MKTLNFHKFSANGNDFVILDRPKISLTQDLIKKLCDRRFGIGADGVLVIKDSSAADGEMLIFNLDGLEADMCGNGLRSVVSFIHGSSQDKKSIYTIKTKAGLYEAHVKDEQVILSMNWKRAVQPKLSGLSHFEKMHFVFTGVPHLVFLSRDTKTLDVKTIAQTYRFHPEFPEGTNVSFLQVLEDSKMRAFVRTFERGVEDVTHSCGTGLTACALALEEWFGWSGEFELLTQGGSHFLRPGEVVTFRGEVHHVFSGDFFL